jgi:hypothetical protein
MLIDEARERYALEINSMLNHLRYFGWSSDEHEKVKGALAQFAARIHMAAAADEREACAVIAERTHEAKMWALEISNRIRAQEEEMNVDG